MPFKPTFRQVFGASLFGLGVALAILFWLVVGGTRETLERGADRLREALSSRISERVDDFLGQAPAAARQVQFALSRGLVDATDHEALEALLLAPLMANPDLGEITFTYGRGEGFDAAGMLVLGDEQRGQISVARMTEIKDEERFRIRLVDREGDRFVATGREIGPGDASWREGAGRELPQEAGDPTRHPTFLTPASREFYGRLLWSDLHWSELDDAPAGDNRRVTASVQQVMTDAGGRFAGVLRVALLARQLDRAVQLDGAAGDPHIVLLCDAGGRLVTRGNPADVLVEDGNDLRVSPQNLPPVVAKALKSSALRESVEVAGSRAAAVSVPQGEYFATFQPLPAGRTQDWVVAVIGPKSYYLGALEKVRGHLLLVSGALIAVLLVGGSLVLHGVRQAQARITKEANKMNAFDFTRAPTDASIRDVHDVLSSLERAKTAMRAMSKYVPVGLVRLLYQEGSEPAPGGEPRDVSLMFTDIAGFTGITENLPPERLATALGSYLDGMAAIIQHETGGTIDKYIGDAIMAFWNAPLPLPDHAAMACRAALRCRAAGRALALSPAWQGIPIFETRFGLHCGTALVGHFGAADRLNYTAIGDAVNLASRLEGLNKLYGTTIIASEAVVAAVGGRFVFRVLDKVAVKGKQRATLIYELLGEEGEARGEWVGIYEQAFGMYLGRDFAGGAALLGGSPEAPGRELLRRCRHFSESPPDADWDGTHVATDK